MKKRIFKFLAVFLALNILFDAIFPTTVFALTGGPSQPEVQGFTPVGTSDMVNTFSGDFNYNIPLMDIGGYPINISYQSGITMDQEASWVGLGWSLNPGVIMRNMRSLPDDFNGDIIKKEFNLKANTTYGVSFYPEGELFGVKIKKVNVVGKYGLGLTYNNYTGIGFSVSLNTNAKKGGLTGNLGLSAGSESGVGISPSLSYEKMTGYKKNNDTKLTGKVGLAYNSRAGLQALTISTDTDKKEKANKDGEKKTKSMDANGSSSISFASPSYTPHGGHEMLNVELSVSMTLGGEIFGAHPEGRLLGSFSGQFLRKNFHDFPAYGYMYSEQYTDAKDPDKVLLDFNREKDAGFTEHTPALPLTNFTYDVYSVSGQGIGGNYRPHRSDIGIVFDSKTTNVSAGIDFPGIELGAGNAAHPGVNFSLNESNSRTGKWEDNNTAASLLGFIKEKTSDPLYEPYYFKQAGEKTTETDPAFFTSIGDFSPVSIKLEGSTEDVTAMGSYDKAGTNMNVNTRSKRARRNEVISILNAEEATLFGEVKKIENYPINNFTLGPSLIDRKDDNIRRGHHNSQITSYRADGAKYVYGIPAYNLTEDDKTFAIEGGNPDLSTGLVSYDHSAHDDMLGNNKGLDNYFDKSTMPAYAHSYLLTEVLSADYVDATGNGPSDDDYGTYTKINYSRINNYKWRVPYNLANYNEGFKSIPGNDKGDDKASYIYGEKELWYIHSIETKNYVAEFTLADRKDGYGVKDEQGGWSSSGSVPVKKLMKITLYSKQDLRKNGSSATPIKTVHFEYDYSLCKGVDNNPYNVTGATNDDKTDKDENGIASGFANQGGKLTLKKIYFTYGNSKKGKLSPYEFKYADMNHDGTEDSNPSYNLKGYDRWGNYKPNPAPSGTVMTTSEFPYVEQTATANTYAASWHMTSINLPSGGTINIDYEADDYAYVQNKRAMQMIQVLGATYNEPAANTFPELSGQLYNGTFDGNALKSRSYLVFKRDPSITTKEALGKAYFQEKDGTPINYMYFKFFMDLGRAIAPGKYEFVPGYAQITDYNLFTVNNEQYAWVKLKTEVIGDKVPIGHQVNPISQAGWNFTKLYLPRLAYGKADPSDAAVVQILESMVSTLKSIVTLFTGFDNGLRMGGCSKTFVPEKSFIRLYNPVNSKKGGGSRVKRIALSDQWKSMTGNTTSPYQDADYGQEYDYTTEDGRGNIISSGVAAYEPLLGGDENPFREPVFFEEKHKLAASDDYYQEKPYGESFFPGPSVGYSKVTVKNLVRKNSNGDIIVKRNATGKVVNEFYTAKDFPTKPNMTSINPIRKKPNFLFKLLKVKVKDYTTVSQGFVVERNDMHGKPKATWVYQEGKQEYISGVEYKYKASQQPVPIPSVDQPIMEGRLDNNMLVMEKNGSIGQKMVGVDYDFITDMREQKTTSRSGGLGGNLDAFVAAVVPVAVPVILPSYSQEKVRFRSVVTTKVIDRYGILEETIAHDLGSTVSTKNKMLDAETGEVLLTETVNQFDDPVYSLTYPAHWSYDRMGPAYKNIGLSRAANDANPGQYFVPGDEVSIKDANGNYSSQKGWVKKADPYLYVIDIDGNEIDLTGKTLKILRSGRRNQQSTSIGGVTSNYSPLKYIDSDNIPDVLSLNAGIGILNASAVEFTEDGAMFCECGHSLGNIYNPYVMGTLGNWKAVKSYLHLTDRTLAMANDNTNVRKDGIYTSFSPFWNAGGGTIDLPNNWSKNAGNWQFTSEVTIYSPFGNELENRDALGRYSSAIFGYNNTLPLAVAANAEYREIAFDSFEDYDFDDCPDDHFSFESLGTNVTITGTSDISESKSHSGRKSIRVAPNSSIELKKQLNTCTSTTLVGGGRR